MSKNRWFHASIVIVLVVMTALTTFQFVQTNQVVSANSSQGSKMAGIGEAQENSYQCPFTLEQIRSTHLVYIKEIGHTIPFNVDGPTGEDGGLYMLRYCGIH